MRRSLAATGLILSALTSACSHGPIPEDTAAQRAALTGKLDSFYVVLDGPAAVKRIPKGVDPRSSVAAAATRARVAEIAAEHAAITPELERRGAVVTARLSRLANAIQIVADEETARGIERLPGVRRVERVPLAERLLTSAVPVIGAPAAWSGSPMIQGDGITIGIIDSGIDYTHADFGGEGTADAYKANDSTVIEPGSFPTAKVVGGWDFVGDAYDASGVNTIPQPDADPLDCATLLGDVISGGHGTHVAGIAAGTGVKQDGSTFDGPYEASFDPTVFRVGPGVAPRAKLFALKVFGCEGSTQMLGAALDRAADPNDDGMFDDRLDVVNTSLGTSYGLSSPTTGEIVAELTSIGTLIVAAAGNDGQNFFATGAPASYPEVLSVAASADNDLLTLSVTSPPSAVATYPSAEAQFTARLATVGPVSGELVAADPALGCDPLANAAAIAGKIALLHRGTCAFVEKVGIAADAGAIAAVVIDNEAATLPFAMSGDPGSVAIPGVMVTQAHGALLEAALAQGPITIGLAADRYTGPGAELLAGFSSRGPSPVDGRFKPEITAPGAALWSAGVATGTEPMLSGGTSMASPMIAGAAALVRQARPDFTPFQVKAALVNATVPLGNIAGTPYGTSVIGAGRVDLSRAVQSFVTAAADPMTGDVGVSFGSVVADEPTSVKRSFVVTNHDTSSVTLGAAVQPTHVLPGVVITVTPSPLEVQAGQTATVELTLSLDPAALGSPGPDPGTPAVQGNQTPSPRHYLNETSGVVRLIQAGGGVGDVVLPYTGSVRAAVRRKGAAPSACSDAYGSTNSPLEIALVGGGAHPEPVVTAFQLGAIDEANAKSATDPMVALTDLRAVGVATDLATAASFDEAQVFFGVAIEGIWTTPARGPISVVTIEINTDQKGAAEYEIRVEARNPDGPFRDSLNANLYDRKTGERITRRPINVVAPDVAKTHPFYNSVLVLSAGLAEIGLTPESPVFGWAALTERPDLLVLGDKITGKFDAAKPLIDTARHGLNGSPLFLGDGPVKVQLSPDALTAGTPLEVLLLHHTNVPGQRWEVVDVTPKARGNLSLTAEAPAKIARSATGTMTLVVTNTGLQMAPNVTVSGNVVGGDLVAITAEQGSCAADAPVECTLGDLASGAIVKVTATVRAASWSESIALLADVESDLECESARGDNRASAATTVPAEKQTLQAGGGCGCRVGDDEGGEERAGWLVAAFGLLAAGGARLRGRKRAG